MGKRMTSTADEPFKCLYVHIIYRSKKQRKERFAQVNEWIQDGEVPTDLPDWCEITLNHGGGGGP